MREIRLLTAMVSETWSLTCGDEKTLDDAVADEWVRAGIAEYVQSSPETTNVKHDKAERAVARAPRQKARG